MPGQRDLSLYRILDASLNRATEGLRVCEDFCRFGLDDGHLTGLLKDIRHELHDLSQSWPVASLHGARDIRHDVGAGISRVSEQVRGDLGEVSRAGFQRAKQALRSLEEYSKTLAPESGCAIESLRYRLYAIEAALTGVVESRERLAEIRLCALIDGGTSEQSCAALGARLAIAGARMIQIRDKHLDDRELLARSRAIVQAVRGMSNRGDDVFSTRPLVIINDRADLAAAADADGVHVGQDDLPVQAARSIVGLGKLVGVSTHSLEQARRARLDGADYLGVGPIFSSATKQFDAFPGLDYLRRVTAEIQLPAFAIGGITMENLASVIDAGARRVAVGSSIVDADDPVLEATRFAAALSAAYNLEPS